MAAITRLFDRLAEDEDEVAMQTMSVFYGPFFYLSLLFPRYIRSERPKTLVNIAFAAVVILSHFVFLSTTFWMERRNLELASLVFNYGVIIMFYITVISVYNSHYNRKLCSANHATLGKTWGRYQPGNIYEDEKVMMIQKVLDREFLLFLTIPGGVVAAAGLALVFPYMLHYGETRISENGVNRNLLIPCYYPFPTEHGMWHVFTIGIQGTAILLVALVVLCNLLTFLRIAQRLRFEFRVASYALKTLFSRAAKRYMKTYAKRNISEIDDYDPEYQKCVGLCLRDVVIHHHAILDLAGGFDAQCRWPLALAFWLGTGTVGLSLINILSALNGKNYEDVTIFALLLVGEVANIFTVCLVGEAITTDSEMFHDTLYFIDWYKLSIPNRRILLNLQVGSNQPYVMMAGGIAACNHDTFSTIMNSAYSFFNLVNIA